MRKTKHMQMKNKRSCRRKKTRSCRRKKKVHADEKTIHVDEKKNRHPDEKKHDDVDGKQHMMKQKWNATADENQRACRQNRSYIRKKNELADETKTHRKMKRK